MCPVCKKKTLIVVESEVQDLRVCLKSADRELRELKDERREERRGHDTKVMAYLQKVSLITKNSLYEC